LKISPTTLLSVRWVPSSRAVRTPPTRESRRRGGAEFIPVPETALAQRDRVGFLASLRLAVLDGELVALDASGKPDFPLLCGCLLMGRASVALAIMAFDLLRLEGRSVMSLPYSEGRAMLEQLNLNGRYSRTPEAFDDGDTLWDALCEHELEGLVTKRQSSRYIPGERGWMETKNRAYWRYELEREPRHSLPPTRLRVKTDDGAVPSSARSVTADAL
jgi:ATP dependent DNA ligase domain